jgi:hypothetical protein
MTRRYQVTSFLLMRIQAMAEIDAREILRTLALRLRSKAEWEFNGGYYTTEVEAAKNEAMKEVYQGVASEIEDLLLSAAFCYKCARSADTEESIRHRSKCSDHPFNIRMREQAAIRKQ